MIKEEIDTQWEKIGLLTIKDIIRRGENPFKTKIFKRILNKYGVYGGEKNENNFN